MANDLALAQQCLAPDGIIALDDFLAMRWPEVSAATFDFLRGNTELVPALVTTGKLYIARPAAAKRIAAFAHAHPPRGVKHQFPVPFFDNQVVIMHAAFTANVINKLHERIYH